MYTSLTTTTRGFLHLCRGRDILWGTLLLETPESDLLEGGRGADACQVSAGKRVNNLKVRYAAKQRRTRFRSRILRQLRTGSL